MSGLHAIAAWIQQETSARRPGLDQTGVVMRTASVLLLLLPCCLKSVPANWGGSPGTSVSRAVAGKAAIVIMRQRRYGKLPRNWGFRTKIYSFAVPLIFLRLITGLWSTRLSESGTRRRFRKRRMRFTGNGIITGMKLRNCLAFRSPGFYSMSPG